MIEHATVLAASGAVLGIVTVVFALGTRRLKASSRRFGYAAMVAAGAMSVTYVLMSADVLTIRTSGGEESLVRFGGYTIVWAAISYVVGSIAGAGRRYTLAIFGCSLLSIWGTLLTWVLDGTVGTLASATILVGVIALAGLLYGPVSRIAATASGERSLLYSKLKHLILLAWIGLLVTGMLSEQNLGLTDSFIGQLIATYIDLILLVGFGGLVLRSTGALETTAATSRPDATAE